MFACRAWVATACLPYAPFSSWGLLCHQPYVGHHLPYATRKAITCHVRMQCLGYHCSLVICSLSFVGHAMCCFHVGHHPPMPCKRSLLHVFACSRPLLLACHIPHYAITCNHRRSISVGCARAGSDYLSLLGGKPSIQKVGEKLMIRQ
jgi:hypothetical protein